MVLCLPIALSTALVSPASAFCGTYVGSAGASMYNEASQVVIARRGDTTTLTLANDFQGDPTSFAMLVPVPTVLGEGDVREVDPSLITSSSRGSTRS